MANNRMYLCHRPSGLAVYLGKRMEWGWYDAADDLGAKVRALFNAVERSGEAEQDDFRVVLETNSELQAHEIENFRLITGGSGELLPEYRQGEQ